MTPQQYLERLECVLSKSHLPKTEDDFAIIRSAAEHFATLLREEIEGKGKTVPRSATEGIIDNMAERALSDWSREALTKWYNLSTDSAPSRLEQLIEGE